MRSFDHRTSWLLAILVVLAFPLLIPSPARAVSDCLCNAQWKIEQGYVGPALRYGAAMAHDAVSGMTIMFGGRNEKELALDDTWQWDGNKWTQLNPTPSPPARSQHAMVYDASRQVIVLYGGSNAGVRHADTWEWDGANWSQSPAPDAGAHDRLGMAYDPVNQVVVKYGGDSGSGRSNKTWEYTGTSWVITSNISPPGSRSHHAMAFDPISNRVIMFGGVKPGGIKQSDTWSYDAATDTWTELLIAGPSARGLHSLTLEESCDALILQGGLGDPNTLGDTWRFENGAWSEVTYRVSRALGARERHAVAYDATTDRLLLFGGRDASSGHIGKMTWAYDCWTGRKLAGLASGYEHISIGSADVEPDSQSAAFYVHNIGSSGLDGVAVWVGETDGYGMCFDPPLEGVGAKRSDVFTQVGSTNNEVEDEQFIAFTGSGGGGSWNLGIDFSNLGASGYNVHIYDGDTLVHSQFGLTNGSEEVTFGAAIGEILSIVDEGEYCKVVSPPDSVTSVTVMVLGQPYVGDKLVFKPDAALIATTFVSGETLTTTLNEVTISCAYSRFADARAVGSNGSFLEGTDSGAELAINIPEAISSDNFAGVTLAWEPEGGCDQGLSTGWNDLSADVAVGDVMRFEATGDMGGVPATPLGSLEVEVQALAGTAPTLQYDADYSDVGSVTQRIQVFNLGLLVQEFIGHAGPFTVDAPTMPSGCGKELVNVGGWDTACYRTNFPAGSSLTLGGIAGTKRSLTLPGDEIAVLAEAPAGAVSRLESFSILGSADFPTISLNMASPTGTPVGVLPRLLLRLDDPQPNPFNPEVRIGFVNPQRGLVSAAVYDISGRRVRQLMAPGRMEAGPQFLRWRGIDERGAAVASGVYIFQVRAGNQVRAVKATLVK